MHVQRDRRTGLSLMILLFNLLGSDFHLFIIIHMVWHVITIVCSLSYTWYDMLTRLFALIIHMVQHVIKINCLS